MNLTLEANPSDAPCCVKITREDGKSKLFQIDYEFCGVASNYGWTTVHAMNESTLGFDKACDEVCPGSIFTDGTIACPTCFKSATSFIEEARQYLDDNDGAVIPDDCGYFDGDEDDHSNGCECSGEGCKEHVESDAAYFATPCGTFCVMCMTAHAETCEVCRNEFGL